MNSTSRLLPLSSAQQGIWWDIALRDTGNLYSVCDYAVVNGVLNVEALVGALKRVFATTASCRFRFVTTPDGPRQYVDEEAALEIPIIDLRGAADPFAAAVKWIEADYDRPHRLDVDSLFRNAVLQLGERKAIWYRNYHHIIADGYSMGLLGRWVAAAYDDITAGRAAELRGTDYREYLAAQAAYLDSARYAIDAQYWRTTYSSAPDAATLSCCTVRTATTTRLRSIDEWLPSTWLDEFYELAGRLKVGLGQILISATVFYLHRVLGRAEIPILLPTHGRERGSTLDVSGMCVNTLAIVLKLRPVASLAENIAYISEQISEALQHRHYRFEDVRKDLGLAIEDVGPFRIHVNVIRAGETYRLTDEPGQLFSLPSGRIDDLAFVIFEDGTNRAHFHFMMVWNDAMYEQWEIKRHGRYFQRVLESLALNAEKRLVDCKWFSMEDFVTTEIGKPQISAVATSPSFVEMFERQVDQTPNAIALDIDDVAMTYVELEQKVNALAYELMRRGVRAEVLVGICLTRSIEGIVAMLAVWKAGGAFLYIDPDLPEARIDYLLGDARPLIVLSRSQHEFLLSDRVTNFLFLDTYAYPAHTSRPIVVTNADSLAYVIYTSGSTGNPKGTLLEQRGVGNLACAQSKLFGVRAGTRVLQFASWSFDACISEIVVTLGSGGTLIIVDQTRLHPLALKETLQSKNIEVVTLPPSVLPVLENSNFPKLQTLIVAGESCPASVVAPWLPRCRVINAYGPTEATVCATASIVTSGASVSIGVPISNVSVYILDDAGSPCPVGIVGEIFIGGIGVGRGYLNRQELTALHFLPDLFSSIPLARMYRTGDLARYLPDGNLQFLGRRDQQIKLRGHRIELGEIEAILLRSQPIVECAVVRVQSDQRDALVAYVVTNGETFFDAAQCRIAMRRELPDLMVPAIVVPIKRMPRTSSGKIDRHKLPKTDVKVRADLPSTDTGRHLAKIWSQVLGIQSLNDSDDFFDLGGSSLSLVEVALHVHECFGLQVIPQVFYKHRKLIDLASWLDSQLALVKRDL
jgi:amino acid adenylation domain-containing protein